MTTTPPTAPAAAAEPASAAEAVAPIDRLHTLLHRDWLPTYRALTADPDRAEETRLAADAIARLTGLLDQAMRVGLIPSAWPRPIGRRTDTKLRCPVCGTTGWDHDAEQGTGVCDDGHRWSEPAVATSDAVLADAEHEWLRTRLTDYGITGDDFPGGLPVTRMRHLLDVAMTAAVEPELAATLGTDTATALVGGIAARRAVGLDAHAQRRAHQLTVRRARATYPGILAYAHLTNDNLTRALEQVELARADNAPADVCWSVPWAVLQSQPDRMGAVQEGVRRDAVWTSVTETGDPVRAWYLPAWTDDADRREYLDELTRNAADGGHLYL